MKDALKNFLLSDYNELKNIKERIDKIREEDNFIKKDTENYLFARYENYRKSQAAKIINILGITVCPYCNQNHINIVYEGKNIRFRGDQDHFFRKKETIYREQCRV